MAIPCGGGGTPDRQRHPVAPLELAAPGSAQCRRLRAPQVVAGGDRHQSLHHPDAGQQPLESDQDCAERQHRLGGRSGVTENTLILLWYFGVNVLEIMDVIEVSRCEK